MFLQEEEYSGENEDSVSENEEDLRKVKVDIKEPDVNILMQGLSKHSVQSPVVATDSWVV